MLKEKYQAQAVTGPLAGIETDQQPSLLDCQEGQRDVSSYNIVAIIPVAILCTSSLIFF